LSTLFRIAELVPEVAIALMIALLLAIYALVRFDLPSHVPSPR
jgi:hypothetical protein